jgi:ribonuclease P protein component
MLPKSDRLTAREIDTLSEGRSVFGTLLSLRHLPSSRTKFAVSVSKKVLPRAVDRNRVRRKIYGVLAKTARITNQSFVMIMPKKDCLLAPESAIAAEISSLFAKAKLVI